MIIKETAQSRNIYASNWFAQNQDAIRSINEIIKPLLENQQQQMSVIEQPQIQQLEKSYFAQTLQIRKTQLLLNLRAESFSFEISPSQLLNFKDFENLKIILDGLQLNSEILSKLTHQKIQEHYQNSIKRNQYIVNSTYFYNNIIQVIELFKSVPVLRSFVAASEEKQQFQKLITQPFISTIQGQGLFNGIQLGITNFLMSIGEVGSNIGSTIIYGARSLVTIAKK